MALVMLATSVGITTKVHFCSMKKKSETKTASCCKTEAEEEMDCCKPEAKTNPIQNSCCSDVVKSVALAVEYAGKFETAKIFSFAPLFVKTFHENLKFISAKTDVLIAEIKQPPKLFDTTFIYFLQVIKI